MFKGSVIISASSDLLEDDYRGVAYIEGSQAARKVALTSSGSD